jgi:hypothetical protein
VANLATLLLKLEDASTALCHPTFKDEIGAGDAAWSGSSQQIKNLCALRLGKSRPTRPTARDCIRIVGLNFWWCGGTFFLH